MISYLRVKYKNSFVLFYVKRGGMMAERKIVYPGTLTSGFLLTSIIGFFVSIFIVYKMSPPWGFTFSLVFVIMFISAMISLAKSEVDDQLRQEIESSYPVGYREHIHKKRSSLRRLK
jgi:hypothetical protein